MLDAALLIGCLTLGMDPVLALSIVDEVSGREPNAILPTEPGREPLVAATPDEAAALAASLAARGEPFRIGLMGLDAAALDPARLDAPGPDGVDVRAALDPCTNLALGERRYLEALGAATAVGLVGEDATRAALGRFLSGDGGELARAAWSRRAASARWLAARRPSTVPVRPRRADERGSEAGDATPGSSTVAWTPRRAVTPGRAVTPRRAAQAPAPDAASGSAGEGGR